MFKIYSGDYQWDRAKEIRKKKVRKKMKYTIDKNSYIMWYYQIINGVKKNG